MLVVLLGAAARIRITDVWQCQPNKQSDSSSMSGNTTARLFRHTLHVIMPFHQHTAANSPSTNIVTYFCYRPMRSATSNVFTASLSELFLFQSVVERTRARQYITLCQRGRIVRSHNNGRVCTVLLLQDQGGSFYRLLLFSCIAAI